MTDKQRMAALIEEQPDDATYDELLRELAFERMIDRGIADADAGRTISTEELRDRIKSWDK